MPQGASRTLDDPFADKKSRWPSIIVLIGFLLALLYILNQKGLIHEWTGGVIGKSPVVTGTVQGGGGMSPKTVVR